MSRALPLIILIFSISAHGQETVIEEQIAQEKEKFLRAESERRVVMGRLYQINRRIKELSTSRARISERVIAAEGAARGYAREIAELEAKVADQRRGLRARLRALYLLSGDSALRLLFSSSNLEDIDQNSKYLRMISDRDYEMIRAYQEDLFSLKQKRKALSDQVARLLAMQTSAKKQEKDLIAEQESRVRLLTKLRKSSEGRIEKLVQLRAQSAGGETTDSWMDVSIFEKKGRLGRPIAGMLIKSYGLDYNEEFRLRLSHKGLAFSAPASSEVKAIYQGQVAFAGALDRLGPTVILDHGDHYYSIYGQQDELKVSVGDRVNEGEVIGLSAALYFELRHFSDAIDPLPWFKQIDGIKQSQLEEPAL